MPCVQLALNAGDIDGCGRPPHQAVWQQASQAPFPVTPTSRSPGHRRHSQLENRGDGAPSATSASRFPAPEWSAPSRLGSGTSDIARLRAWSTWPGSGVLQAVGAASALNQLAQDPSGRRSTQMTSSTASARRRLPHLTPGAGLRHAAVTALADGPDPGVPAGLTGPCYRVADGRKRRSRRLLVTTNTELKAMVAPAISGLRNPAAASGMAAVL